MAARRVELMRANAALTKAAAAPSAATYEYNPFAEDAVGPSKVSQEPKACPRRVLGCLLSKGEATPKQTRTCVSVLSGPACHTRRGPRDALTRLVHTTHDIQASLAVRRRGAWAGCSRGSRQEPHS
jgi:hypothetical protein